MQNTTKKFLFQLFITIVTVCSITKSYAGGPLWTIATDPYYPPAVSITPLGSATVKYLITNQSPKVHTLAMQPITGVIQDTTANNCSNPFTLSYQQSCTLSLVVNGSALTNDIVGGPIVCQQGSGLQCYQPASANILNIRRIPLARYIITPSASANGTITPATSQTIIAGSNLTLSALPNTNYNVDQWIVDAGVAQRGGATFTISNILANHAVQVTFTQQGTLYAGTTSGGVYFTTDNGLTWTATTTVPSTGFSVNSIFATSNTLYVGSADGKVYYSTNNGTFWSATTGVPGGTAINSVYVKTISGVSTIFVATQNGKVYSSTDGISWTATTNPGSGAINSIFLTSTNAIYVGSADGNVYYSTNLGTSWNTINGPTTMSGLSIQNVYAIGSQLYINVRHLSSNNTLPSGTVDFEYAYSSNSLTNPSPTWSLLSQIAYTLFVNSDASLIYAGTQNGHVFSLTTGDDLGFTTYSPITGLFFLG